MKALLEVSRDSIGDRVVFDVCDEVLLRRAVDHGGPAERNMMEAAGIELLKGA
jgi:hypothetical protein